MPDGCEPFSVRTAFDGWEHAAENILAHFQSVFNGNAPYFLDLDEKELQEEAKLDEKEIAYLKRTKAIIKDRGMLT